MLPKETLTFLGRLVQSLLARGKSGGDCGGHSFFSNWLKLGSTQRQTWEKKKVYTVTGHKYNSLGKVPPGTSVSPVI